MDKAKRLPTYTESSKGNLEWLLVLLVTDLINEPDFRANICLDEDVLKTSRRRLLSSSSEDVFKTSLKRLDQDEYVRLILMSSEDVFKTSLRRLGQDQYIRLGHTSSRLLQDVSKTSSRRLANILSRRFQSVSSS